MSELFRLAKWMFFCTGVLAVNVGLLVSMAPMENPTPNIVMIEALPIIPLGFGLLAFAVVMAWTERLLRANGE